MALAASFGLMLLGLHLTIVGRDALSHSAEEPAVIVVKMNKMITTEGGYVDTLTAVNRGADLQLEGALLIDSRIVETSTASIDYVPAYGRAEGGMYFKHDPAKYNLRLRPLGYQMP